MVQRQLTDMLPAMCGYKLSSALNTDGKVHAHLGTILLLLKEGC